MCYSLWGCKESDMTEQLNKNNPERSEGWRRQGTCVKRRKRIKSREGKRPPFPQLLGVTLIAGLSEEITPVECVYL